MTSRWDAVFIGSGLSALTCGAFLAKKGMRVKVLEKHYRIGGYAHSFSRKPYRFESGIHSVPIGPNGYINTLLRALGVDNRIETVSHNCMYTAQFGDKRFVIPSSPEAIRPWFYEQFPNDRSDLDALLADMGFLYKEIIGPLFRFEPKGNETNPRVLDKYLANTYKTYIQSYIKNPELQNVFFAQWPFAGVVPDIASTTFSTLLFYVHAVEGSHYIKGGFETLAEVLADVIREHGGEVTCNSEVMSLCSEHGKAKHALLESGETIEADRFISNISPITLFENLLDRESTNRLWVRRSNQLTKASSALAVYLGFDTDINALLQENIVFWYKNADFTKINEHIVNCDNTANDHLILLKTPDPEQKSTLFLMKYANECVTINWTTQKDRIADSMIADAEKIIPGMSSHIVCKVTASPQTFKRYTGNSGGSLYGYANLADRYSEARIPMQTFIPNLYQTGHWCRGGGVWNVMESGYTVARKILGENMM
jgi:phytoene dehydrogenase-like protein